MAKQSIGYPHAYIITTKEPKILELLRHHGIEVEEVATPFTTRVEQFIIDSLVPSRRLNQGHYCNKVYGSYTSTHTNIPKGAYIVKTQQRLGRLACYLLEPQSDDGLMQWNFLDRYIVPQWGPGFYTVPIFRAERVD